MFMDTPEPRSGSEVTWDSLHTSCKRARIVSVQHIVSHRQCPSIPSYVQVTSEIHVDTVQIFENNPYCKVQTDELGNL